MTEKPEGMMPGEKDLGRPHHRETAPGIKDIVGGRGERERGLLRRLRESLEGKPVTEGKGTPPPEVPQPPETPPREGPPTSMMETPVPKWIKERWAQIEDQFPNKKRASPYEARKLIDDYHQFMNQRETRTRRYTDADNTEFDKWRGEIFAFLSDEDKFQGEKERALWLYHEGEARYNLHQLWWEAYYGPDGIGKTFANVKKLSRIALVDDFAVLMTIPGVKEAHHQRTGFIPETQLYGYDRIGHELRRLNMTSSFVDAMKVARVKHVEVAHPAAGGEKIKVKVYGPGRGVQKSFEFAPYRVYHTLDWAVALHPPEEWLRFIEPVITSDGKLKRDDKGEIEYLDHTEFGYQYDQWHDPDKAHWYILIGEEGAGKKNWQMLTEGIPEKGDVRDEFEKGVIEAREIYLLGNPELTTEEEEVVKPIEEVVRRNLIRLCQNRELFLDYEEIQWDKIFSDRDYFRPEKSGLADDLFCNLYVNCSYMEDTQTAFFDPKEGYLKNSSFETLRKLEDKFEHLPSADDRTKEVDFWFQEFSDMLYASFEKATGANRGAELAGRILQSINQGMDRQFYRRYVFRACGIKGKDWTNIHQLRLSPSEKIRLILQHLPDPDVWEKGIFDSKMGLLKKYNQFGPITFRELVAAAEWRFEGDKIFSREDEEALEEKRLGRSLIKAEKAEIKERYDQFAKEIWGVSDEKRNYILKIFQVDNWMRIIEKRQLDRLIDTAVDWYLDLAILNQEFKRLRSEIGLEISDEAWNKIKRYLPGLKKRSWWQDLPFIGEGWAGLRSWASGGNRRYGRRWSPMNDLWTREKLFWLIKRKTMKYAVGEHKDWPILKQNDWDQLKNEGVFAPLDRLKAELRDEGAERIANLLMGAGELIPGSIHRLPAMYLYYDRTRLLWHELAPWSVGYWEQAAEELGLDWNNLQMWRMVMTPEKHLKIIEALRGHNWISEKEKEGWMVTLGCEETNQVWGFRKERKGFLIPDIEGKVTPEAVQEGAEKLLTGITAVAGPAAPAAGLLRTVIPIPQTLKEAAAIARASLPLGLISVRLFVASLAPQPFTLLAIGPTFLFGALLGAHLGKDRGDELKGIPALFFGPLSLKGFRRWPGFKNWGFPFWNGRDGKRQIRSLATWATPVWDDWVNPEIVVKAFQDARQHLGDQASYR